MPLKQWLERALLEQEEPVKYPRYFTHKYEFGDGTIFGMIEKNGRILWFGKDGIRELSHEVSWVENCVNGGSYVWIIEEEAMKMRPTLYFTYNDNEVFKKNGTKYGVLTPEGKCYFVRLNGDKKLISHPNQFEFS